MEFLAVMDIVLKLTNFSTKLLELSKISQENDENGSFIASISTSLTVVVSSLRQNPALTKDENISPMLQNLLETCEKADRITKDEDSEINKTGRNLIKKVVKLLKAKDVALELKRMEDKLSQAVGLATFSLLADIKNQGALVSSAQHQQGRSSSVSNNSADESLSTDVCAVLSPVEISLLPDGPGGTGNNEVRSLVSTETSSDNLVPEVYPLVLFFPIIARTSTCPISIINKTDNYVVVWIKENFNLIKPITDIIKPRSNMAMYVELYNRQQQYGSWVDLEARMVEVWSKTSAEHVISHIVQYLSVPDMVNYVKKLSGKVHPVMKLKAVAHAAEQVEVLSEFSVKDEIRSIDLHPTNTWILMTHVSGHISIWNYQTQESLKMPTLTSETIESTGESDSNGKDMAGFLCAIFISRNWVAAGDNNGNIHIYYCTGLATRKVKEFVASSGKMVESLAVHRTKPYLLSSSTGDDTIRLWDWSKNWEKITEFKGDINSVRQGVRSLKFDPRDTGTFACVTKDGNAMVWNIESSLYPTITLPGVMDVQYVSSSRNRHFLGILGTSASMKSRESIRAGFQLWDLQKQEEPIHTLNVWEDNTTGSIVSHPTEPILATFSPKTGNVRFWDAGTYRLEKEVHIVDRQVDVRKLFLFTNKGGLPRLLVQWGASNISVVDATFPPKEKMAEQLKDLKPHLQMQRAGVNAHRSGNRLDSGSFAHNGSAGCYAHIGSAVSVAGHLGPRPDQPSAQVAQRGSPQIPSQLQQQWNASSPMLAMANSMTNQQSPVNATYQQGSVTQHHIANKTFSVHGAPPQAPPPPARPQQPVISRSSLTLPPANAVSTTTLNPRDGRNDSGTSAPMSSDLSGPRNLEHHGPASNSSG